MVLPDETLRVGFKYFETYIGSKGISGVDARFLQKIYNVWQLCVSVYTAGQRTSEVPVRFWLKYPVISE